MEFAHVGAHCAYDLCGQQTFLPFDCESCHRPFCALHCDQESHQCLHLEAEKAKAKALEVAKIEENKKSKINRPIYKCHRRKCRKREWIKIECNRCLRTFCLKHRSPDDHVCKLPVLQQPKHCGNQMMAMMARNGNGLKQQQSPILVQWQCSLFIFDFILIFWLCFERIIDRRGRSSFCGSIGIILCLFLKWDLFRRRDRLDAVWMWSESARIYSEEFSDYK